jgi:hypothetical protein
MGGASGAAAGFVAVAGAGALLLVCGYAAVRHKAKLHAQAAKDSRALLNVSHGTGAHNTLRGSGGSGGSGRGRRSADRSSRSGARRASAARSPLPGGEKRAPRSPGAYEEDTGGAAAEAAAEAFDSDDDPSDEEFPAAPIERLARRQGETPKSWMARVVQQRQAMAAEGKGRGGREGNDGDNLQAVGQETSDGVVTRSPVPGAGKAAAKRVVKLFSFAKKFAGTAPGPESGRGGSSSSSRSWARGPINRGNPSPLHDQEDITAPQDEYL